MKKLFPMIVIAVILSSVTAKGDEMKIWQIISPNGQCLTQICEEPVEGDEYITADNQLYRITNVVDNIAYVESIGKIELPSTEWMSIDTALAVSAKSKRIAMYCTHSDESYEPSDGYYSTIERGSIYQIAQKLADALTDKGVEATVADTLHHPHDAGAYRRSRQTAVQLLKTAMPDCLIDIHRDGIPDPSSYAVTIGGEEVSKIRLLVGRGNQNAAVNKEFALQIKAVADRVYPGLIKDIYMGKGTFNQDLLPRSILFECGTYTIEKERVLTSMALMADVLNRTLYGGVVGSAGRISSDSGSTSVEKGGITQGEPDFLVSSEASSMGSGVMFLLILLVIGVAGFALLSSDSLKRGAHKAGRHLSEMTGGLIGKKPDNGEEHEHS